MKKTIEDVYLRSMQFSPNGTSLSFSLFDMANSSKYGEVSCNNLCYFRFRFAPENGESLPQYIGEITWDEICGDELYQKLKQLDFGFFVSRNPARPDPKTDKIWMPYNVASILQMEGAISINIVCEDIIFISWK